MRLSETAYSFSTGFLNKKTVWTSGSGASIIPEKVATPPQVPTRFGVASDPRLMKPARTKKEARSVWDLLPRLGTDVGSVVPTRRRRDCSATASQLNAATARKSIAPLYLTMMLFTGSPRDGRELASSMASPPFQAR